MRLRLRNPIWILILAVIFSAGVYLVASSLTAGPGFPLDDAWIHQTYARNLGLRGEWAFFPGHPSAGSTSILWSALLALSFALKQSDPRPWTYFFGSLSLLGVAVVGEKYFRILTLDRKLQENRWSWLPWVGLFLAGEYHLVWAAVSGMETDLMAFVFLACLVLLSRSQQRWGWLGFLAGLACWVRPDGLTLLGTILLVGFWSEKRWSNLLRFGAGFVLVFLPYLVFNVALQGTIWPNTFYAKQAEYAILQQRPLLLRFMDEAVLPLIGGGIFLLPGFVYFLFHSIKEKNRASIATWVWFGGYVFLYAWRLPVTYQYGRYIIPAMPIFFILGVAGTVLWLRKLGQRSGRLTRFAWLVGLGLVTASFYFLGANRYAQDVAIIETEMVPAAHWVAANTDPQDLIAAHDIGAMGYFGNRQMIDLAGLVTPEVIPFIRDEAALARYLDRREVKVLVVFPDWYTDLPAGKEILFASASRYATSQMTVYRWK